ncbi:hypothetical protein P152DRAFT_469037 [Eremomyces bilateralis CBS 781.70]|uniref:WSC domain-containing protein n=1 Tax=Eremomyces bilateralis CBS 781.70 TaxID=1392243 RepID=A0A6G1FR87_9PEZI|nr:uncharacterized protein P152DRAFT_469037 [Eremomyces bilateralis CBS 781.70]KAF1808355.1 hypothetical protein P152DRAFT_469037 [Eremomyces bilateralis CBS 781.70]
MQALTMDGCYATPEPLTDHGPYTFQTSGNCQPICYQFNKPVMALSDGSNCWCGDLLPQEDAKTDNTSCNTPCNGFPDDMCGGNGYWSVYLTGITKNQIAHFDANNPGDPAASRRPGSSTGVITVGGSTVVVTQEPTADPEKSKGSSPSKVGIAVGVVVGVLAIAGIIGGVFFFLRQRRRRELEEEHKRQAAVSDFVKNGRSHGSQSGSSGDSRLDPEAVMHRRMSDGSIADNQDYSRRILKVTNPDDGR